MHLGARWAVAQAMSAQRARQGAGRASEAGCWQAAAARRHPPAPASSFASRACRADTGSTVAAATPSRSRALSSTNAVTSSTSSGRSKMSTLFRTNTTFLPHCRIYRRKVTCTPTRPVGDYAQRGTAGARLPRPLHGEQGRTQMQLGTGSHSSRTTHACHGWIRWPAGIREVAHEVYHQGKRLPDPQLESGCRIQCELRQEEEMDVQRRDPGTHSACRNACALAARAGRAAGTAFIPPTL